MGTFVPMTFIHDFNIVKSYAARLGLTASDVGFALLHRLSNEAGGDMRVELHVPDVSHEVLHLKDFLPSKTSGLTEGEDLILKESIPTQLNWKHNAIRHAANELESSMEGVLMAAISIQAKAILAGGFLEPIC